MSADLVAVQRTRKETGVRAKNPITAAAARLKETIARRGHSNVEEWQKDAIELTKLVGEQEFIVNTLANRVGAGRLYAGKRDMSDPTQKPTVVDENHIAAKVLRAFGKDPMGQGQLMTRMSLSLSVPGDGWWVGIPDVLLVDEDEYKEEHGIKPEGVKKVEDVKLEDLQWYHLSISEFSRKNGKLKLKVKDKTLEDVDPKSIWAIRCWNPDAEFYDKATSPTRASLPILRELVGLTMHVSAQIDSRLAGAGVWLIPQSAVDAVLAAGEYDEDADPFGDALHEAVETAIADRASAAALEPITLTVPDASIEFFKHMTFFAPLDKEARQLREEAIRRLALGQNVPPEILLGTGGLNHWGAWLVREDTITTYVTPQLLTMCDALTTQYLWPILEENKIEDAHDYVIWYDVDHLVQRPNRLQDAIQLHQVNAINDAALRDAGQFPETAAQTEPGADEAANIVLKMVQQNASLLRNPGVDVLLENIRALLSGKDVAPEAQPEPVGEPIQPRPAEPRTPPIAKVAEPGPPAR